MIDEERFNCLYDQICQDRKEAWKAGDIFKRDFLGVLMTSCTRLTKNPTDDEVKETVVSFIKGVKENLDLNPVTGKVINLRRELKILQSYLPAPLEDGDIRAMAQDYLAKAEKPDAVIGVVMKVLREQFTGQYDGKHATNIVKEEIAAEKERRANV